MSKLWYGNAPPGSREALLKEFQRERLTRDERLVLDWLFERIWPSGAHGMQPLCTRVPEIKEGVPIAHARIRTALKQLEERSLIQRFPRHDGWDVQFDVHTIFGDDVPADRGNDPQVMPFRGQPSQVMPSRGIDLPPELVHVLSVLVERAVDSALNRRPPLSTEASVEIPEASGGLRPLGGLEEEGGGGFINPPLQSSSSVLPAGGLQQIHRRPPVEVGQLARTLGSVEVRTLQIPHGSAADPESRTKALAKLHAGYTHCQELFLRWKRLGYVSAEEREDLFAFLFTLSTPAWIKEKKIGNPAGYIRTLIVNGDWRHNVDPAQREIAAACARWLDRQHSETPSPQPQPRP